MNNFALLMKFIVSFHHSCAKVKEFIQNLLPAYKKIIKVDVSNLFLALIFPRSGHVVEPTPVKHKRTFRIYESVV